MTHTAVIIGASLAGMNAARTLRLEGHDGDIVVVDPDRYAQYDRPPLSKQFLAEALDPDRIMLQAAREDLGLDLRLGTRATALDTASRVISVQHPDGSTDSISFDGLVIASGASARRLPDTAGIGGVHVVRTVADSLALRSDLDAGPRRVVVIGAGFIGGEVAATCRGRGLEVTLVEAMPVPLERALGAEMGAVCAQVHVDHGVDVRLATGVDGLETTIEADGGRRVRAVNLSDGTTVPADVVVVGIGVQVNTGWLEGSGLTLDDGIVCDPTLLAAPGVTAAGDIARYHSRRFDRSFRIEHWEHAIAGGEAAARTLLAGFRGAPGEVFDPVPWFWSDQYDRKIQLAGRPEATDVARVVHGSTEEFRFVTMYGREGRLVGVLGMNRPRHVIQLRGMVEESASFDEACARAEAM
jgi:3-phenylpropionate/trans-cinnamate dioxygenase ferredoxin reductase component